MTEPTAERYNRYKEIVEDIDRKLQKIQDDTGFSSSKREVPVHPDFKALEAMGDVLIPYLFHVITHRGANWVVLLLLNRLAPENPIKEDHRGQFYHIIHDWLGWYLTSSYRNRDDIYHGLVD